MKYTFVFIFVLSLTAGGVFGYYNHYGWIGYTIAFSVSGFIGSSIIAVLFSYLYLFQKDTVEPESIPSEKTISYQHDIKKMEK
ncbi:MAG: hypothetical protein CSA25_06810 [Desulfobacter postgatei]|uniref:Uncharacterized protein n=1 Tax=Desulfobacter postgatei TaxID=2293 RepID=A0A2G6MPW3_9BACT|nr:MAG: hypothetical protein CSA25_06810 [Desulfobacter postgatei]